MQFNEAKGYDSHGCLDSTKIPQESFFAKIQYSITNNGMGAFTSPSGFVGWTACYTPIIVQFLHLSIQGGKDGGGNAYPIELDRFATCVVDDSYTATTAA